jgi:hypothetical protein
VFSSPPLASTPGLRSLGFFIATTIEPTRLAVTDFSVAWPPVLPVIILIIFWESTCLTILIAKGLTLANWENGINSKAGHVVGLLSIVFLLVYYGGKSSCLTPSEVLWNET